MYKRSKKSQLYIIISVLVLGFIISSHFYLNVDYGIFLRNIYAIISVVTILFMFFIVIMENRSPHKTLSWILVLFFLPVIGIILYFFFGRNFRKRKIFSDKEFEDYSKIDLSFNHKFMENYNLEHAQENLPIINNLIILMNNNDKALLTFNNKIDIFTEGNETYQEMLKAIENAEKYIHLEFFSVTNDDTGRRLRDLLISKAKEGLEVKFLVDSVGSWTLMFGYLKKLKQNGIQVGKFLPVNFPLISSKLNYRNHRKILIIDGKIGFMGGVNIGDKYVSKSKYYGNWRDTHLRMKGEAVHSLETIFFTDWLFTTGENLFKKRYFPEIDYHNYVPSQIVTSGPDSNWESIMQSYFTMINSADNYINITSPYLVLNESLLTAIKVAALRGVEVKIIVPQKPDHHIVFWGSRSYFGELLEAGVKIYEYKNGFIHSKSISIDGIVVSIGTANMDVRSFYQNFEVNAVFYSSLIAKQFDKIFESDLLVSDEITLEVYEKRSVITKIKESFCRLFSPLL